MYQFVTMRPVKTQLVGILNLTPDSFSDGDLFTNPETAIRHADNLFECGASLIDVGAESTRPGATPLTSAQEWQRLEPVLPTLLQKYPNKISLDTYHAETANHALELGNVIINDITGLNSPAMTNLVLSRGCQIVISHAPNVKPILIHQYAIDDINAVTQELLGKAHTLEACGVSRANIILDPGIGFGKTMRLNKQLLSFARNVPSYNVMIGYSRKRFLGPNRMQLTPNLNAAKTAIDAGARYLRIHDVAGHAHLVK